MENLVRSLEIKSDKRGWLAEIFRDELSQGQIYAFSIAEGETRGGHYHKRKTEWFCIFSGSVSLYLEDIRSGQQVLPLCLSASSMQVVHIAPWMKHTVSYHSGKPVILAYIDEKFNPEDADTYFD